MFRPPCCFFKQKTAYEIADSDWSSDVCSSDLLTVFGFAMIWHIWWLAIVGLVGTVMVFVAHAARDDQGYMVPVDEMWAKTVERLSAE